MNLKLKLWATSILVALLATSLPSVAEGEDKDAVREVLVPNVLHVDATTGAVRLEDKNSALTDVHVTGVQSQASGFDLINPAGVVVFANQSSTFSGVVEFWYEVLVPGIYTVNGPVDEAKQRIVSFDATPYSGANGQQCEGVELPPYAIGVSPTLLRNFLSSATLKPCLNGEVCLECAELPAVQTCPDGQIGVRFDSTGKCVNEPGSPCEDEKVLTECVAMLCERYTTTNCDSDPQVPTVESCPDGQTGVVVGSGISVDDQTTTCIKDPPCDSAMECVAYVCATAVPDDCTGAASNCAFNPSPAECLVDFACDNAIRLCENVLYCVNHPDWCTPAPASPDPNQPPSPPSSECVGDGAMLRTNEKLSETTVWTPTLIIHAPYGGSADAVGTWAKSNGVFIGGHGKSSTIISTEKVGTTNGRTVGSFRAATWGYYHYWTQDYCGTTVEDYYYSKIIDDEPNGFAEHKSFALYGSSLTTDRDDHGDVSGCGTSGKCYDSMHFVNGYRRREVAWDATQGSLHPVVGARTYQAGGASLTFSLGAQHVSASIDASWVADKTSEVYYEYDLPAGGKWSGDYLGANAGSAIAFCDDIRNGQC